jgi:hypothetical protein
MSEVAQPASHEMTGYDFIRAKGAYRARCSCGWRSDQCSTAGLAFSLWDQHLATAAEGD